jgi:hypothetical protein
MIAVPLAERRRSVIVVPRPIPAAPRRYLIMVTRPTIAAPLAERHRSVITVPRPMTAAPRRYLIVMQRP